MVRKWQCSWSSPEQRKLDDHEIFGSKNILRRFQFFVFYLSLYFNFYRGGIIFQVFKLQREQWRTPIFLSFPGAKFLAHWLESMALQNEANILFSEERKSLAGLLPVLSDQTIPSLRGVGTPARDSRGTKNVDSVGGPQENFKAWRLWARFNIHGLVIYQMISILSSGLRDGNQRKLCLCIYLPTLWERAEMDIGKQVKTPSKVWHDANIIEGTQSCCLASTRALFTTGIALYIQFPPVALVGDSVFLTPNVC